MKDFIACCGLDCEVCEARLATVNDDDALRQRVARLWTELNGVEIHNGDFIGFVGKEMMLSEPSKTEAAHGLLHKMFDGGERFMLTVFFGKDTDENEKEELQQFMAAELPDVECYFLEGGQDIYPFIFVAE